MIYRFKSKLAIHDRIEAYIIGVPGTDKKPLPSGPRTYEENFKKIQTVSPACTVFQAPEYEDDELGISLMIARGKEKETLPDIWGHDCHLICSQKFKDVLGREGDLVHQCIPLSVYDEDLRLIEQEQSYYWLNIRRFVALTGDPSPGYDFDFIPFSPKEYFVAVVARDKGLYKHLSWLPIWRYSSGEKIQDRLNGLFSTLYMSQRFVTACREANITGMDLFSAKFGVGEESLARVRLAGDAR